MKKPSKLALGITAGLVILAAPVIFNIITRQPQKTDQTILSKEAMRETYACNRLTHDLRATDVYCNDYDRYVRDAEANTLIE